MKDISLGLVTGKKGIIFGVANDRSLAWHIAERLHAEGAELAFTHLPPPKMERRVRILAEPLGATCILPCDVTDDEQIRRAFQECNRQIGPVDFVVHSIAFATRAALANPYYRTARADFLQAMDISVYSLVALCQHGLRYMNDGGAVLTLTYLGSGKLIPGYNVMGVCKAALESSVRYLAGELGREKDCTGQCDLRWSRADALGRGRVGLRQGAAALSEQGAAASQHPPDRGWQCGAVPAERPVQRSHRRSALRGLRVQHRRVVRAR